MTTEKTVRVLSIDAWRDSEGGWTWNNWFDVGRAPIDVCNYTPRRLLAWFRAEGYLRADSAGRCAIEDDGYNVVVLERHSRMPVFALEYGAVDADTLGGCQPAGLCAVTA